MKLLIVDDELITREGIIKSMPWSDMGIDQIMQADDGVNALKIAEKSEPDIILTDVRMPRMDGIEMAFKLKAIYRDCLIIFMSGYSDKEYLLSAIQLKAVNYVEKPIKLKELKSAIQNAINLRNEALAKISIENIANTFKEVGIPLLRNELTLLITNNDIDIKATMKLGAEALVDLPEDGLYNTLLVKFTLDDEYQNTILVKLKASIPICLDMILDQLGVNSIYSIKDNSYIIIHLFVNSHDKHLLSINRLNKMCSILEQYVDGLNKYYICAGNTSKGLANAHISYESAMNNMKMLFFEGYNKICSIDTNAAYASFDFSTRPLVNFITLIEEAKYTQVIMYVKNLVSEIKNYKKTPIISIKNYFTSILVELYKHSRYKALGTFSDIDSEILISEMILGLDTFTQIEEHVVDRINRYFDCLDKEASSSPINKICNYIHNYYSDEDLSISKISQYTHFAPTYMCSLFKEKTNKTLNQYITEYRIEKSIELLKNMELNISEISTMVGYSKSGYFTKLFKKATGTTPSEYREKLM